jgi:TldD protein
MKPASISISLFSLSILIFTSVAFGQNEDPLVPILENELNREFNELKTKDIPPYYMDFRVAEMNTQSLQSNLGSLINQQSEHGRTFYPSIRVGDYSFDNTHTSESDFIGRDRGRMTNSLPLDNIPDAIRFSIWETTNELYRDVVQDLIEKRDRRDTSETSGSGDFSREVPAKYYEPRTENFTRFDPEPWKERINKYSAYFKELDGVMLGTCQFNYRETREYFLNTEGTSIVQNQSICELSFFFLCRSSEDQVIPFSKTFYASTPDKLPSDEEIQSSLNEMKTILGQLILAPKGEPYTGPAILSAGASGVFFHEIFGHRIEGHRFNDALNSKTFKEKIGQKVIEESISVISDPTLTGYNGKELMGHYVYDNQGILGQKVVNVEKGILRSFLMSRKPVDGFAHSNGHGRSNIGFDPIARQSNMIITTTDPVSMIDLRKNLVKECKKQKLAYGYYFKTVSGGFTNVMNYMPDFFNIIPIEVYKIYVDGRPDELIRGVNLIGTPMIMFSEILTTGDDPEVFSGICGAESGLIPVSTISPSILVRKVETQNQFAFKMEWPILPDPEKQVPLINK